MTQAISAHKPITREALITAIRSGEVHVIGAASAEGVAVARLLQRLGCASIVLHDFTPRAELRRAFRRTHGAYSVREQDAIWAEIEPLFAAGRFGDAYLDGLEHARVVCLGQGWRLDRGNQVAIEQRLARDAYAVSMVELYFALAPGSIAGITGTNGKSTTVALTASILAQAAVAHVVAGNERSSRQPLPHIEELAPDTLLLMEISNRQLVQVNASPHVAAIVSLTPDHLEEHNGWDGYVAAKRRIFLRQSASDVAIAMADDPVCRELAQSSAAQQLTFCGADFAALVASLTDGGGRYPTTLIAWRDDTLVLAPINAAQQPATDAPINAAQQPATDAHVTVLARRNDLHLRGVHNLRNAAVAAAVAIACGASPEAVSAGLGAATLPGMRMQELEPVHGVRVISDLKATTPEATLAALRSYADEQQLVLIAGGTDKGLAYDELAAQIVAANVRVMLLPGSASDKLAAALIAASPAGSGRLYGINTSFVRFEKIADALRAALTAAQPDGVVMVSPAAAGFWSSQLRGSRSLKSLLRSFRNEEIPTP